MTTATMTLTEFLEARLGEDEAAARAATIGPWRYDPEKVNSVDRGEAVFAGERGINAVTIASTGPADDPGSIADAAHIARHDPARVLREVEAKRVIVHRHFGPHQCPSNPVHTYYRNDMGCPTLRDLAAVYSDHDQYREDWRA